MAKTYNTIATVATGDVYTATAHNAIGTNVNNYRVPPACRQYLASSTRANGDSIVAWTSAAIYDTESPSDPMHSTSTNNTRITIRTAGLYLVVGNGNWGVSATGNLRAINIKRNGSFIAGSGSARNQFDGAQVTATHVMSASVGDYFEMETGQNTGGSLSMTDMYFSASWLGQVS